jgi:hypothetical protein
MNAIGIGSEAYGTRPLGVGALPPLPVVEEAVEAVEAGEVEPGVVETLAADPGMVETAEAAPAEVEPGVVDSGALDADLADVAAPEVAPTLGAVLSVAAEAAPESSTLANGPGPLSVASSPQHTISTPKVLAHHPFQFKAIRAQT